MKTRHLFFILILILLILIATQACKKDKTSAVLNITTLRVNAITPVYAECYYSISASVNSPVIETGVCWSIESLPEIIDEKSNITQSTDLNSYKCALNSLKSNTKYYVRAYISEADGVIYGNELTITTPEDHTGERGILADIDQNQYNTIGIGSQIWMVENLRTTRFNDSTDIPYAKCFRIWSALTSPGYCWYNNEEANKSLMGALYNWYTVGTGKLCPVGWHVPDDNDWTVLETYLGGSNVTGGKLKEKGYDHWISPNDGATDISGLTFLPGGLRGDSALYMGIGKVSVFWTSTGFDSEKACFRSVVYSSSSLSRGTYDIGYGAYVRCIRDN